MSGQIALSGLQKKDQMIRLWKRDYQGDELSTGVGAALGSADFVITVNK